MEYDELVQLIDKLDQTSIAYLKYAKGSDEVELSKGVPYKEEQTHSHKPSAAEEVAVNPEPVVQESTREAEIEEVKTTAETAEGEAVLSPMVGVVYLQANPEDEPYVKVGDKVEQGETVILIEAMKLMTEIQAHTSGVVTEICVENEEVVEYNQPLIKIQPQS